MDILLITFSYSLMYHLYGTFRDLHELPCVYFLFPIVIHLFVITLVWVVSLHKNAIYSQCCSSSVKDPGLSLDSSFIDSPTTLTCYYCEPQVTSGQASALNYWRCVCPWFPLPIVSWVKIYSCVTSKDELTMSWHNKSTRCMCCSVAHRAHHLIKGPGLSGPMYFWLKKHNNSQDVLNL